MRDDIHNEVDLERACESTSPLATCCRVASLQRRYVGSTSESSLLIQIVDNHGIKRAYVQRHQLVKLIDVYIFTDHRRFGRTVLP